ncbi:MAG: hypothetical protein HC945_00240 [Nitrosarchaeum sp.]|nr:hypothetical protein [Nitrosarchaeum sp.]
MYLNNLTDAWNLAQQTWLTRIGARKPTPHIPLDITGLDTLLQYNDLPARPRIYKSGLNKSTETTHLRHTHSETPTNPDLPGARPAVTEQAHTHYETFISRRWPDQAMAPSRISRFLNSLLPLPTDQPSGMHAHRGTSPGARPQDPAKTPTTAQSHRNDTTPRNHNHRR